MKQYTLFLIYAIGRDTLDFWTKMEYDLAFEEVQKCYTEFIKSKARINGDLYQQVEYYLMNLVSDNIKI